ncbi:uncharacterized protein LOC126366774 isoform X2 [Pectinophora gossypiella]|nr:uncharacterized protein LOC126366774 isoform X2 [Pectinophora gossypiella]
MTTILILQLFLSSSESVPYGSLQQNQRGFFQPPMMVPRKVFIPEFYEPPENVRAGLRLQFSFTAPQPFNPVQFTPTSEQNWLPDNNLQDNLNIQVRGQNNVLNSESPINGPQKSTHNEEQGKLAKNNIKEDDKTNDVDNLKPYDVRTTTVDPYFTTEDTTGTTDEYDTSTFLPDELNRSAVSAPIVATLLGG